ncbi:MAG: AAA family ATPase [Clostridia bacterium]|nr:AAA family ATPase [Clostridia bacterium]
MKKIVTALGNTVLNNELKKYSKYDILTEDIFYQEGLIDFIRENETDVIVISGLLQGQFGIYEFVSFIRDITLTARIILIVDTISEEDKNMIISKGVFDILNDNNIEIQDVIEAIDREDPINYKAELESKVNSLKEAMNETKSSVTNITTIVAPTQKQEVITVFGTNGSGKSSLIVELVKKLSTKTKSKILLIDLDTLNGNLDELLQVPREPQNVELIMDDDKKCGLNYAADLCLKNRFDTNVLDELVIKCNGFDFLSGNTSMHYCQNVLNEGFYDILLKSAKEKYDFIFLDISSNMFLDSTKWALKQSSNVLFVTENTNICLKKMIQTLEVVFKVWKIYKDKFKLIINRYNPSGIDEDVFAGICKIKCIGRFKENGLSNDEAIEKVLSNLNYIPKKSLLSKIQIGKPAFVSILTGIKS